MLQAGGSAGGVALSGAGSQADNFIHQTIEASIKNNSSVTVEKRAGTRRPLNPGTVANNPRYSAPIGSRMPQTAGSAPIDSRIATPPIVA